MRISAVATLAALSLALVGCGGDDKPAKEAAGEKSTAAQTIYDVCNSVKPRLPETVTGDWSAVISEAEFYKNSDVAEVRALSSDFVAWATPMLDYRPASPVGFDGMEAEGFRQAKLAGEMMTGYRKIAETCGWGNPPPAM